MHAKTINLEQHMRKAGPGPGNYEVHDSRNPREFNSPKFSIGTSQRIDLGGGKEGKLKPGPGRYNQTIDFKRAAPKFAFGKESRPDYGKLSKSPGPGEYAQ